jgi:hypothetical protein
VTEETTPNLSTGDEILAAIQLRVDAAQTHLEGLLAQKRAIGPLISAARVELAAAKTYLPRAPRQPKPATDPVDGAGGDTIEPN